MKTRYILTVALAVVAFTGCQKEKVDSDRLQLIAEGMGSSGAKLAVNNEKSYWVADENVRINDVEGKVVVNPNEDGSAYVNKSDVVSAPYCGVYPASIYSSNSTTTYTLNLPDSYQYATTTFNGKTMQNLASPMVAYSTTGNRLYFKHVTAAIGVQVVNYYGFTVEVDSVVVESNSYKLHGAVTLTMAETPTVVATTTETTAERRVKMDFSGSAKLRICAGDSAVVQVPVLPVGAGNKFTVKAYVHKKDQASVIASFEKTQATGGALGRAKMGYARFTTPGLFSISASKKVIISQGNLMYQASTGTWKFSETQYGYIGNASGNTTDTLTRKTQSDWIDLFGWGTSGAPNGNVYYMPYDAMNNQISEQGKGYGTKNGESYEVDLTGVFDWGYNAISNGGNKNGVWRTLETGAYTPTEWYYLFNSRATGTYYGKNNARYAKAVVNEVKGVILFPDEFSAPELSASSTLTSANINSSSNFNNTIALDDWYILEAEGAVFLPCAGYRNIKPSGFSNTVTMSNAGSEGDYWSCVHSSTDKAYGIRIYSSGIITYGSSSPKDRAYGYSVRLVKEVD